MNTAAAPENWEGQMVDGKFPLLKWLGGSERSDVFRTQLPGKEPQDAAIKLVSPEAGNAERQVSRWQMAATLTHPHVLRVFHAGQCKINNIPLVFVVMEYAEEDLSQVLPSRALSAEEVREMMPPLLDAISYLHSRGLVHGHIKPSNIMAVDNHLKLSTDSIRSMNDAGEAGLPSTAFDAPEVRRGVVSRAADVWSLGVTLVRCLSPGKQARENYNPVEQGIAQTIPEPFRRIARECLRPDPKARCTVADIREWLRTPVAAPAAIQRGRRRIGPSPRVWVAIAAIVLVVAILVLRWATRGEHQTAAQTSSQPSGSVSTQPSVPAATNPTQPATPGQVTERVLPDIAVSARNTIQGRIRVSIRVAVSPAGEVINARLVSPGPSKYFANKALDAARRWKFKPPTVNGQPASSEWNLRFMFGGSGTEVVPTELPARNP